MMKQFGGYYDIRKGKVSGAGVIMLTYVNDSIPSVILIHSKSKKAFEEPGGGSNGRTKTKDSGNILDTARRELFEETAGVIDIRSVDMYHYYTDTSVRRKQNKKWFYRTYFMQIDDISRIHYKYNYKKLRKNKKTPKEFLETDELIIVPLNSFRNITKIGDNFVISLNDELGTYIPISKRLKRIMTDGGGIELAAKVLLETKAKKASNTWIEHKKGFMKGVITFIV